MKDIDEVKVTQPSSFNHVRCRGVAARARSVHFIYSMDQKLGRKGEARTHPQQHHPVPQGGSFSKKFAHRKSTNNGSGQHQKAHSTTPPPHPHSQLPAWVEQIHFCTVNNLSHTDSLSSTSWPMEGRGKGQRSHRLAEQSRKSGASIKASIINHARQLGMPTHQIRVNWLWSCFDVGNYCTFSSGQPVTNFTRQILTANFLHVGLPRATPLPTSIPSPIP